MYNDQSRNPISALQCADMLRAPIEAWLASAFSPLPRAHYNTGISLGTYNRLVAQYNELLAEAETGILRLKLRAIELEIENIKLRAQIKSRNR